MLETILSSAVVSGAISLWIKSKYDKELETLKGVVAKQNIVFSKLHIDRADVIAEIYALLKDVHLNIERFIKPYEISGEESKEIYLENTKKAWNAFVDYYPKKMIYLPKPTADKLESVAAELRTLFSTYQLVTDSFLAGEQEINEAVQQRNKILKQMPKVLVELEEEFRNLLGDNYT